VVRFKLEYKQTIARTHLVPSNFVAHVISFVYLCFSMVDVVFFAAVSDSLGSIDRGGVIPARWYPMALCWREKSNHGFFQMC
jgi:hypothetical protein